MTNGHSLRLLCRAVSEASRCIFLLMQERPWPRPSRKDPFQSTSCEAHVRAATACPVSAALHIDAGSWDQNHVWSERDDME